MKKRSFSLLRQVITGCFLSLGLAQAASAGIIITRVAPDAIDIENTTAVFFNRPGSVPGPAMTVTGTIGAGRDPYLADFNSTELLFATQVPAAPPVPGVPPQVQADDGGINRVSVSVRDGAFTSVYLNFRKGNEDNNPSRFGEITVSAFGGEVADFDFELGNGSNIFLVEGTDGTMLRDLLFLTPFDNIVDLRGVRFGGAQDAPVPEPATLLSLGIGMAGMVAAGRRNRPGKASTPRTPGSVPV